MLEGISVEWFEVESIDLLSTWAERRWAQLRKATPFDQLLPSTLQWTQELPPNAVPTTLMARFPRVANLLAANWKEQAAFHAYVESLLVDRRGNRQGFPSDIKQELIRLRTYYYLGDVERTSDAGDIDTPNLGPASTDSGLQIAGGRSD